MKSFRWHLLSSFLQTPPNESSSKELLLHFLFINNNQTFLHNVWGFICCTWALVVKYNFFMVVDVQATLIWIINYKTVTAFILCWKLLIIYCKYFEEMLTFSCKMLVNCVAQHLMAKYHHIKIQITQQSWRDLNKSESTFTFFYKQISHFKV